MCHTDAQYGLTCVKVELVIWIRVHISQHESAFFVCDIKVENWRVNGALTDQRVREKKQWPNRFLMLKKQWKCK